VGNKLSGSIPESLDVVLTNLIYLELHSNLLEGKIPNFQGMTALKSLSLSGNLLNGTIPDSISRLTRLERLDLDYLKSISGVIPSVIGKLGQLKVLKVNSSPITGLLQNWFSNLTSLQVFDGGGTFLSGLIPETMNRMKNLGTVSSTE
jgi:Leucine Rich repeats (2 copies)